MNIHIRQSHALILQLSHYISLAKINHLIVKIDFDKTCCQHCDSLDNLSFFFNGVI